MKKLTHTEVQEGACRALKLAMKEGVAHETRQVGDDIQITTVMEMGVRGKVLAVSYPDGGIDYYPDFKKDAEARSLQIQEALAEVEGDEVQAEIIRLKTTILELREALKAIAPFINENWTDEEYHDADGRGWVTVVNDAIRRSEEIT